MTKATKSSQPADRPMGFGAFVLSDSAASLSSLVSSNMVPAGTNEWDMDMQELKQTIRVFNHLCEGENACKRCRDLEGRGNCRDDTEEPRSTIDLIICEMCFVRSVDVEWHGLWRGRMMHVTAKRSDPTQSATGVEMLMACRAVVVVGVDGSGRLWWIESEWLDGPGA